ncbi:hypothetical protein SBRCBS47491_006806 [Sporothrix bragantina]|uniref:Developmental regulator n=1 Tax=Sporothrix bragantina TaxID=671064 RepID=A0ABP0C958_9PEZI
MPAYLCHGFRWHRPSIRVFVIVQDLDDASPDWVIRPATTRSLLEAFNNLFDFLPPHDLETDAEAEAAAAAAAQKAAAEAAAEKAAAASEPRGRRQSISQAARAKSKSRKDKKEKDKAKDALDNVPGTTAAPTATTNPTSAATPGVVRRNDGRDEVLARQDRSAVKLLEEYDPQRMDEMSRPHAYVADYVARIDLSVSIVDEMARYERLQQQRWRREHKTKDGFPSMAGASEEGPSLGAALGVSDGSSGGATLSKKKKGSGWLEQLRDQLQKGEEIRWYIVVIDDEDRSYPDVEECSDDEIEEEETTEMPAKQTQQRHSPEEDIMPARRGSFGEFMERGFAESVAVASSPMVSDRDRERDRERERERQRQRLRYELTGDPNILATLEISPSPSASRMSYRPGPGKPMLATSSSTGSTITTTTTTTIPAMPAAGPPMVFSLPPKSSSASSIAQPPPPQQQQPQPQPQQPNTRRDRSSTVTSSLNSNNIGDDFAFPQPPPMPASAQMQRRPSQPEVLPPPQHAPPQHAPPQPPLPALSPPTLRPQKSSDIFRPKTPNGRSSGGASGFRRLFGRSSKTTMAGDGTKS